MRPPRHPLHSLSFAVVVVLAIVLLVVAATVKAQDVSVTDGAVQSNDAPASFTSLVVYGTGAAGTPSTYTANAPLSLSNGMTILGPGVLNVNANVTAGGWTNIYGGRVNLNAGVLAANGLFVSGTLVRGGGGYTARSMGIGSTTVEYSPFDTVSEEFVVNSGGRLVLSKDLSLTGRFQVDGGEVLRSTARISARQLNLYATTFDLRAGDTFNTAYQSYIGDTGAVPATLNVTGSVAFGNLSVFGGSTVNANAAVSARLIDVTSAARLNVNANVSVPSGIVNARSGGTVSLQSGTLTAYSLWVDGTGALTRTAGSYAVTGVLQLIAGGATTFAAGDSTSAVSLIDGGILTLNRDLTLTPTQSQFYLSGSGNALVRNGHAIAVASLDLGNGATFTTVEDDAISSRATVSGTGSVLTVTQPLALSYTSIGNGGTMRLENFTGSWSGAGGYALSVEGDSVSQLDGYLSNGQLQFANNPGPVSVAYDIDTYRTYVVSATGSQVVSGSTTFFGTVTGSTSVAPGGDATFAGPVAGEVTVDPGAQATFSGGVSGAATVTGSATIPGAVTGVVSAADGGTVVITGSVAPTAQVSVGAGSTVSIGTGATVAQPTLTNAGRFAVANTSGTVALPTAITGTGSFEKTGAGSVQLTGSSTFTGGSTIGSGEVVVQNAKALGSGGVTVSGGGRLLVDGVDLDLGGAAVALGTGAVLETTSGARVTVSGSSDLAGVRTTSPAAATAAILAGTAVSGTLATTWTSTADPAVRSEVLELKTPTNAANPFVLSLAYASGLDPAGLFLGWNDPESGDWVNAVVGNELLAGMTAASGGQLGYLGSFTAFQGLYGTDLSSYLGAYGRDGTSRTVWAVINHNSEFAVTTVIPEPATWALALAGLAAAGATLGRRRRRACSRVD